MITAKEAKELSISANSKYKHEELIKIEQMIMNQIESGLFMCVDVFKENVPHLSYKEVFNHFNPLGYSVTEYDRFYKISWSIIQ